MDNQCSKCGEYPILGTCFQSIKRPTSILCELCLQTRDDSSDFVAEERQPPTTQKLKQMATPRSRTSSVAVANSYFELLTVLRLERASHIELYWNVSLYDPSIDVEETLCNAFAENTTVESLRILLRGTDNFNCVIQVLAKAFQKSSSLTSLTFSISPWRPQESALGAARALKSLLEVSRTIRFLYVKVLGQYPLHTSRSTEDPQEDIVANYLFDGLAESSSLRRFLYAGQNRVSDSNHQKACQALESNPNLRRIDAVFDSYENVEQLVRAVADKNQRWMQQWTADTASKGERLAVLQEILDCCRYQDKPTALSSFLRGQPRLVLDSCNSC